MRILHLGTGYLPISGGGLTRYAHDLMAAQNAAGHEVHYACTGAFDLGLRTRVVRWDRDGVTVHELRNPRGESVQGGRQSKPQREIVDAKVERLLAGVVATVRPDVVHLQSLLGWPASVVDVVKSAGVPAVFTAQNYHAVCPTARLYDEVADEVCEDFAEGRRCVRCNAARPSARKLRAATRLPLARVEQVAPWLLAGLVTAVRALRGTTSARAGGPGSAVAPLPPPSEASETFRARRAAFVAALNRADVVAGMSRRVSELLVRYGVEPRRVRTLHLVLGDLDKIVRRAPRPPGRPLRFGLLNKLTLLKGAGVLWKAFDGLEPERFRLLVFGAQHASALAAMQPLIDRGVVELAGPYSREAFAAVLDRIDVGLVPSIWEEPYGYVGVEFLAAGIPVLGSRIGGIPDYIDDGVNGLLLPPRDPVRWRAAIERLAGDAGEVVRLAEGIRPVKTMRQHLEEIDGLYREAMEGRPGPAV